MIQTSCETYITVVVPAKNEGLHIGQCLKSLVDQDFPRERYEVIVVDNYSKDNTVEIAKKFPVSVVQTKGKVGKVRNDGVRNGKGDIILFIDADCVAPSNWVSKYVELIHANENSSFGGGVINPDDANLIEKYWILEGPDGPALPRELIGANIGIRKSHFERVGGFNEEVSSGEDTSLSISLKRTGIHVTMSPQLSVTHLGNAKTFSEFVKRQIWHSESYLKNMRDSFYDPTFLMVVCFIACTISALFFMILWPKLVVFPIALLILMPVALTTKRFIRAKYRPRKYNEFLHCYALDWLYLCSRAFGLIKGSIKRLFS